MLIFYGSDTSVKRSKDENASSIRMMRIGLRKRKEQCTEKGVICKKETSTNIISTPGCLLCWGKIGLYPIWPLPWIRVYCAKTFMPHLIQDDFKAAIDDEQSSISLFHPDKYSMWMDQYKSK